jgi:hypothetical protein
MSAWTIGPPPCATACSSASSASWVRPLASTPPEGRIGFRVRLQCHHGLQTFHCLGQLAAFQMGGRGLAQQAELPPSSSRARAAS